jgi:predicted dehydrogenase
LLDDKEIDAIIIAVPDHWHKQVLVDAVASGKDVYCEKPMSHSPADGLAMVAAAKKTDRIVQVGAQRTSSVLCAKAKGLLANGRTVKLSSTTRKSTALPAARSTATRNCPAPFICKVARKAA